MVGSLAEFARQEKAARYPCAVCSLPKDLLAEITKDHRNGTASFGQIERWLKGKGHKAHHDAIARHLRERHGEAK